MIPAMAGMNFSSGGGGILDTQTVTCGVLGTVPDRQRGYLSGSYGSVTDGTSNLYGGATVIALRHDETNSQLVFTVNGSQANSGWTKLTVNGTDFARTGAAFAAGATTSWTWSGVGTNPFGAGGTVRSVTFT
jgi:hypothetical protein